MAIQKLSLSQSPIDGSKEDLIRLGEGRGC